jgi:GT2 family glycosyltransferase
VGFALRRPDGSPQPACHTFPGVLNMTLEAVGAHWIALRAGIGSPTAAPVPRGGEGEVNWVGGACFAVSRKAFERVGGLDPESFMYGEEMDWSWRARALGFKTVFSNAATVLHHGGASGVDLRGPLFVRHIEARMRFLRRYRGAWRAIVARELATLGSLLRLCYWVPRAALESRGAGASPWTLDQVQRFRAVLAWRLGKAT